MERYRGGDGGDVAFDINNEFVYGSNWGYEPPIETRVHRSTDAGLHFQEDITPWDGTTDLGRYIATIATDPNLEVSSMLAGVKICGRVLRVVRQILGALLLQLPVHVMVWM